MIRIDRVAGLVTIQDLGRPGRMHEGLAPGGALVPSLLIAANRAAGNADDTPALEVFGRIVMHTCERFTGEFSRVDVMEGPDVVVESGRSRVAYVAVRGGIDAPLTCGGRGTQLSAGIGAALRAGDAVFPAQEPRAGELLHVIAGPVESGEPVRVIRGPDRVDGALEALCAAEWTIAPASDRVGTRLVGPTLPARARGGVSLAGGVSCPMVRGAIELPPDGAPIVLGPEHPTTGGYPVIGVIAHADLDRFFATPIGGRVRFSADAAR